VLLCEPVPPTAELGNAVVDAGAVALLVVCIHEPDVALRRACALALAEIANFSVEVRAGRQLAAVGSVWAWPSLPNVPDPPFCDRASAALQLTRQLFVLPVVPVPVRACPQLATVVSSSGAVPHLVAALKHADAKLKRQVRVTG
jgi:hypothetical protein